MTVIMPTVRPTVASRLHIMLRRIAVRLWICSLTLARVRVVLPMIARVVHDLARVRIMIMTVCPPCIPTTRSSITIILCKNGAVPQADSGTKEKQDRHYN